MTAYVPEEHRKGEKGGASLHFSEVRIVQKKRILEVGVMLHCAPVVVNYGTKLLSILRVVTGYLSTFLVANAQHCACKCAAVPLLAVAYRCNYHFCQVGIYLG